jgi:hypothetical protein
VAGGRARAWTYSTGSVPRALGSVPAALTRTQTQAPPPSRSLALDPSARALPLSAPPRPPPLPHGGFVSCDRAARWSRRARTLRRCASDPCRRAAPRAGSSCCAVPCRAVRACRSLSGTRAFAGGWESGGGGGGGRLPLPLARARWLGSRVLGRPAARAFLFTHTESARARAARPPPRAAWP